MDRGLLRGLAYAHEAGVSHLDLQLHNIVVDERGQMSVMALGVAPDAAEHPAAARRPADSRAMPLEPTVLRQQRVSAERDVLACGIVLHRLLTGAPVLGHADIARVIEAMAPQGREFIRLPWTTPQPIPEPLRAIANRSTAGQKRLRYRSARTFLGALDGWRESAQESGGPVARLLDRLHTVGHLPALPGLAARVQRVTNRESQRTDEIARYLLPDMALSFELLKTLNSAQVQGTQIAGNGPVLTLRRVVALIGVDGVRAAANSLRVWPGPLDEEGARALRATIDQVRLAGHMAQALRPAGYDAEVVYLIAVLQNLGRLLLGYHFADEAEQVRQLMQPIPASRGDAEPAAAEQPGLSEELAAFAGAGRRWRRVRQRRREAMGARRRDPAHDPAPAIGAAGEEARWRRRPAAHRRQRRQRRRRRPRSAGRQGRGGAQPRRRALRESASDRHPHPARCRAGGQGHVEERQLPCLWGLTGGAAEDCPGGRARRASCAQASARHRLALERGLTARSAGCRSRLRTRAGSPSWPRPPSRARS